MASTRRPTYIVETKVATERKRRKSDLVIMWQSIWDVTSIIVQELWMTLLRMWDLVSLWFSSSERFEVQTWLEKYLPYIPDNFSDSWRDGRLLAILLNRLQPGCFPDAYRLDPDYGLRNVYKAFDVLEVYFGIKPDVSVEEIVTCVDGSDTKLFGILVQLKRLTESQPENGNIPESEPRENSEQSTSQSCIAKGTGLAVGFVGRITNFIIFCAFMSDIDVIIDIRGPNTFCGERITRRSPKKKSSMSSWEYSRPLTSSRPFNEGGNNLTSEEENLEKSIISLEYEIIGNQISVSYTPKEKGQHKVTILWHGQHVSDSPFFVTIEDSAETIILNQAICRKSAMKSVHESERSECRKNSVRFQESQVRYKDQPKTLGRVLKKRILRYIVRINGKEIPVNAESIDSLATELMKMEYDLEACPSSHRRNSWGFAGDAERKKSVIRQFGIDVNELESHVSLRRTRSLSINTGSKRLLEKSDSVENLLPRLNIVKEDCLENHEKISENEADFAYLNESINAEENGTKSEVLKIQGNIDSEKEMETFKLINEISENNSDENWVDLQHGVVEFDKISSLSSVDKVDSLNEDLQSNISAYESVPGYDKPDTDATAKSSFSREKSVRELKNDGTGNETLKISKPKLSEKNKKQNFKTKKYQMHKNYIKVKKVSKSAKANSESKSLRSANSALLPSFTATGSRLAFKKCTFQEKEYLSQKVSECLKYMDALKLNNQRSQTDNEQHSVDAQCPSKEILDVSNNIQEPEKYVHALNHKTDSLPVKKFYTESDNGPKIFRFRNIVHKEERRYNEEASKREINEPEIQKVFLNRGLFEIPTSEELQNKSKRLIKPEEPKTLRTHTLKTVEQLNFKQFIPNPQSSISPVKSQIVQWESTLSNENQTSLSKRTNASETEQVSVKEKLAFWENACKTEKISLELRVSDNYNKISLSDNQKPFKSAEGISNTMRNDPQNLQGKNSSIQDIKKISDSNSALNRETNVTAKKDIEDKISPDLRVDASKIRRRSFSDPGVTEMATDQMGELSNFSSLQSSTKDCLNSSYDDNLEQYLSDDSEDSGGDYIQHSTEDEYIDDEISGTASEYWGDLSILKVPRNSADNSFPADDFLRNHLIKSLPDECKVFGIAVYYGYVAVKNRFQVFTGNAGNGNLSVSMLGIRRHDVSLVSVAYVRKDIYEVTYQVMNTGYYLISVRWMDKEIPGSPFVCKVTY